MLTFALDLIVAGLLAATIVYCCLLNRRLDIMREGQDELRRLAAAFGEATEQARASVTALRIADEQAGRALQDRIATARGLADELSLINDSGSRIAERLAESIDSSRRVSPQRPSVIAGAHEPHRSEAERELMQALRRVK